MIGRWARSVRLDGLEVVLGVAYAVLRLVGSIGRPVTFSPDSPDYFVFKLWGAIRFPVMTAFYSLVGDERAIATIQAAFGAIAFPVAAVVAASVIRSRWVRDGFVALVLLPGLSLTVTLFDNALRSESVAVSLTVLFVAVVLRFACMPTRNGAVAVFVLAVVWAMTRQNNAVMLGVAAVVIAMLGASRATRAMCWRLAGGFAVVCVIGLLMASSTAQIQRYNTAEILVRRVMPNPERVRWFESHGMPPGGPRLVAHPPSSFGDPAINALQHDAKFGPWLRDHGPETYAKYVIAHPIFAITTPFSHEGALNAIVTGVPLDVGGAYGSARRILPDLVERFWWPRLGRDQAPVAMLAAAIIIGSLVGAVRDRDRRRAVLAGGGILIVVLVNVMFVTNTAEGEYERLLVPTGVALRFALVWLLAVSVGGVRAVDAPIRSNAPRVRAN